MTDHDAKIAEAVAFLKESAPEDRNTVIELLKDDGYTGNEIMDALSRLSRENTA